MIFGTEVPPLPQMPIARDEDHAMDHYLLPRPIPIPHSLRSPSAGASLVLGAGAGADEVLVVTGIGAEAGAASTMTVIDMPAEAAPKKHIGAATETTVITTDIQTPRLVLEGIPGMREIPGSER